MDSKVEYKVNSKEKVYFYLRLVASLGLYYLIIRLLIFSIHLGNPRMTSVFLLYFYIFLIILYLFFRFGILIGYLKGNAIKLNKNQFPDIYQIVLKQSELLGLRSAPNVFIMQSDGVLNAFAARFFGRNYIVLYSEIVEAAYDQDINILEFIIGHELGHIKRNHMVKNILLLPSHLIPFLSSAYSRACEYTCDNIGHSLSPAGVKSGLLLLAAGKSIFKKVNLKEYLTQVYSEDGFWKWFAEAVSSHPNLTKRLASFKDVIETTTISETVPVIEKKEEDYSRYMPK
jgi:Zn-dependent protease with chaperone function